MEHIEVLRFSAPWCRPCRIYKKTFAKVVDELDVKATEINIDEDEEAKNLYQITEIPTTIVLVDGIEKCRHVGAMLHRDLTHMIQQEVSV